MGALAAILFFLFLLVIGVMGMAFGIVGLILCGRKRKTDRPVSKAWKAVFAVLLSVGVLITLIPVGYFSFIVIVNSVPPEGFVKTEIVIEENGYQDTSFTADGILYEVLDLQIYDTDAISDPVFTYKTKGFLNGSQCGNYYAIKNRQGFRLVSDEFGSLFCPAEEKESVMAYYTDTANLCGYYDDWDGRERKLSDTEMEAVHTFLEADVRSLPQEQIVLEDAEEFEIKLICQDGLVYAKSYWFLILNDTLYYTYDSDFAEENGIRYTLLKLPSDVADPLLAIHK